MYQQNRRVKVSPKDKEIQLQCRGIAVRGRYSPLVRTRPACALDGRHTCDRVKAHKCQPECGTPALALRMGPDIRFIFDKDVFLWRPYQGNRDDFTTPVSAIAPVLGAYSQCCALGKLARDDMLGDPTNRFSSPHCILLVS